MGRYRTLLARVRRLEAPTVHPALVALGGEEGWARFQADAEEGVAIGRYDNRDVPVVIAALKQWLSPSSA